MIFVEIEQCRKENKDWAQKTFKEGSSMFVSGRELTTTYFMQI
jgi:hypothetical protein